ncbi:MAG: lipopolysaccharide biosynthesis protein [Candidatus Omnitrophica bacterium]|nr:lipopolysaccharide biosynthesis protein [Candidatus Omnitrophota bacterium]MDD5553446.1 lipopolysaccharide biosynthesis protein [Candidatus Omnitrophota bacterium]
MENYHSLTTRDYLKVLFRHKAVIAASVLTVMIMVTSGILLKTPLYEAKVKLLISAEKEMESPYYKGISGASESISGTQSEIVKSDPVIRRAVAAVALYDRPLDYEKNFASKLRKYIVVRNSKILERRLSAVPAEHRKAFLFRLAQNDLRNRVKVEPIKGTKLFTITVSDFSPVAAALLANVVSRSYLIFDLEQQLSETHLKYGEKHPTTIQLKDSIEKISRQLNGEPLPDVEAIGPASVKVIEQAGVPGSPVGAGKAIILFPAFLASVLLAVILAFTFEYLDQTFKSPFEIEHYLRVPYLGSIPADGSLSYNHNPAEQIYLLMREKKLKTLLLCSTLSKEDVPKTIANLARHLSKAFGHRVLVIDANLRHPSMHKLFKVPEKPGLADFIEGVSAFDKVINDLGAGLNLITAGRAGMNPMPFFNSRLMEEMLRLAREKYDIILMGTSPLSDFRDGYMLSSKADALALVIEDGKTRRHAIKVAVEPIISGKKTEFLGTILNNRRYPIPDALYKIV